MAIGAFGNFATMEHTLFSRALDGFDGVAVLLCWFAPLYVSRWPFAHLFVTAKHLPHCYLIRFTFFSYLFHCRKYFCVELQTKHKVESGNQAQILNE